MCLGKRKTPTQRMEKNLERAINEHRHDDKSSYISLEEVKYSSVIPLNLDEESDSQQGNRGTNEDKHVTVSFEDGSKFYGVFDGHGGVATSALAAKNAPSVLKEQLSACNGDIPKAFENTALALHHQIPN